MADMLNSLIVVYADGREQVFNSVYKETTVECFKRRITIQNKEPINLWEEMELFAFGEGMHNDRKLDDYGIENGSRIHSIPCVSVKKSKPHPPLENIRLPTPPPPYEEGANLKMVFVMDVEGNNHLINTSLDSNDAVFVRRVAEKVGISENHIRIIYGGKQLDPKRNLPLREYGIQPESTLHIVLRLPGGAPMLS